MKSGSLFFFCLFVSGETVISITLQQISLLTQHSAQGLITSASCSTKSRQASQIHTATSSSLFLLSQTYTALFSSIPSWSSSCLIKTVTKRSLFITCPHHWAALNVIATVYGGNSSVRDRWGTVRWLSEESHLLVPSALSISSKTTNRWGPGLRFITSLNHPSLDKPQKQASCHT